VLRGDGVTHAAKRTQGLRRPSDRAPKVDWLWEPTLKHSGEACDRRMQIQSAGIDLSGMIAAFSRNSNIDEKELAGPTKRLKINQARGLVSHIATRNLWIFASEVARQLKVELFRRQPGGSEGWE
jgi:hypothetical protein